MEDKEAHRVVNLTLGRDDAGYTAVYEPPIRPVGRGNFVNRQTFETRERLLEDVPPLVAFRYSAGGKVDVVVNESFLNGNPGDDKDANYELVEEAFDKACGEQRARVDIKRIAG